MSSTQPLKRAAKTNYFVWEGTAADLSARLRTPEWTAYFSRLRLASGPIKIWCPEDNNIVIKVAVSFRRLDDEPEDEPEESY